LRAEFGFGVLEFYFSCWELLGVALFAVLVLVAMVTAPIIITEITIIQIVGGFGADPVIIMACGFILHSVIGDLVTVCVVGAALLTSIITLTTLVVVAPVVVAMAVVAVVTVVIPKKVLPSSSSSLSLLLLSLSSLV